MRKRHVLSFVILVSLATHCAGTETDNPAASSLVDFGSTPCKKEQPPPDAGSANTMAARSAPNDGLGQTSQALSVAPEYDGLFCIAWERTSGDTLRVTLHNFHQTCGVDWKGNARVGSDGTVDLDLVNSGCRVALCGWCIYDAAFEIRGVHGEADTSIRISVVDDAGASCKNGVDGRGTSQYAVTLPTKGTPDGIVCRPALSFAVFEQVAALGTCGTPMSPCGDNLCTTCNSGLACAPLVTDDSRCLTPCTADVDCPIPDVLSCQDGFCRLTKTW